MKIAICVNGRAHEGGVTSFINSVSDGLRELGHNVDVVTIFGISKYRDVRDNLVVKTDKFLNKNNLGTFVLYNISKIVLLINFLFAHIKNKYDVLFAIDISVVNATRYFVKIVHIPVFLSVHSSIVRDLVNQGKITVNSFVSKYITSEEARAYRNVKGIIANSQYTSNYIKTICTEHASLTIIKDIVDDKKFYKNIHNKEIMRIKSNIPKSSWVILFVGRIVERKGVRYLIHAFNDILKIDPTFMLILVGKGEDGDPEKQEVDRLIDTHGLQPHIRFFGTVPNDQIGEIYNLADVLVVPSVTHMGLEEPLGITALEGMAAGVPVIASRNGGLKEIIQNGVNGLLVPEKTPEAIVKAIIKLKTDSHLKQKLINNALKEIRENYTPKNVAERITSFFKFA